MMISSSAAAAPRRRLLSRRQTMVVLLALNIYLAATAAYFTWLVPASADIPLPRPAAAQAEPWVIFGQRSLAAAAPLNTAQAVPPSALKAQLLGVLQAVDGNIAIIDIGRRGESRVFREGDELSRRVTVHRIEPARVLLNESGAIRSLVFVRRPTASGLTAPAPLAATGIEQTSLPDAVITDDVPPGIPGLELTETAAGRGIPLAAVRAAQLRGSALQPSDVILRVAGVAIEELVDVPDGVGALLSEQSVDIVIWREGSEQAISVNPNTIAPAIMTVIANQQR